MKYTIEIEYSTGDSFGSHDEKDDVGCVWEDKEQARLALSYIKDHYELYKEANKSWGKTRSLKEINADVMKKPWRDQDDKRMEYWQFGFVVPCGNEQRKIHAFWCGYFESLHSATIVCLEDDLDSYRP